MKRVRLVIVLISWIAFAAGLLMTGLVSFAGSKSASQGPVVAGSVLPLAAVKKTLELERAGPVKLALALAVRPGRDAERIYQRWLEPQPEVDGAVKVEIRPADADAETFTWQLPLAELTASDETIFQEKISYLVLQRHEYESPGQGSAELRLSAASKAAESSLSRLNLIVGDINEDFSIYVAKDPKPGLLLLAGMAGVFSHLFMILGRLAVPFSAIALPDDGF